MNRMAAVRPLSRVFVLGVVALAAIIGMPYLIAMAMQTSTPAPFDLASPAASPQASPSASPVADVVTGTIIVTLHDENGDPIGGACWQLLQGNELVSEGCDIEGEFGMNGRYGFFNFPAGEYTIVQSLSPEGAEPVDEFDVEIIAGVEQEIVIETTVELVASPSSDVQALAVASPISKPSTPVAAASPVASPAASPASAALPMASPSPAAELRIMGVVVNTGGSSLNCRAEPDTMAEVLMAFPLDSEVTILGDEVDGWLPVDCNGQDGWVSALFVQVEP